MLKYRKWFTPTRIAHLIAAVKALETLVNALKLLFGIKDNPDEQ